MMTYYKPSSATLTIFLSVCYIFIRVLSERVYNEVLFTSKKCKELGYGEEFDACVLIEFCSSSGGYIDGHDEAWNYELDTGISTVISTSRNVLPFNFKTELTEAKEETRKKTPGINAPIINNAK